MQRIFRVLAQAGRVLTGRKMAGRNLSILPDDVFLVSYPKSGNTWIRFLIGNLISRDEPVTFANVESRIPEIYFHPDRALLRLPRPRLLKSHECFQPYYPRVIYIVRDPRDVAVSMYHYCIKRHSIAEDYPIERFVPRFVNGEFLDDFGAWSEHVRSWLLVRQGDPNFLCLRYEDILQDPLQAVERTASFLALDTTPEARQRTVDLSTADHMRALEREQSHQWHLTKNTRQDKPFIRAASSGTWTSALPESSVVAIESAWGPLMQTLGYTPAKVPVRVSVSVAGAV